MERVGVEEMPAVGSRGGGHDVVQRALDDVGEAGLAGGEQQSPGEHHRADAGARLGVGAVRREHEVIAERLARVQRAHPAGQVGAPGDRRLPLPDHGAEQLVVAGLDGDVDGAGREVHRPHGVAAEHGCLADRHVVLKVRLPELDLAERAAAPALDEPRRLVEVALVAGFAGQLDEPELDLRMAADPLDAAVGERLAHVVGDARRDGDELVVTRCAPPGHRRLQQMAVVVQLVAPLEVAVARRLAGPPEHRVEVAVRFLGRGDHRRQLAEALRRRRPSRSARPPTPSPPSACRRRSRRTPCPRGVRRSCPSRPGGSCRPTRAAPSSRDSGRAWHSS